MPPPAAPLPRTPVSRRALSAEAEAMHRNTQRLLDNLGLTISRVKQLHDFGEKIWQRYGKDAKATAAGADGVQPKRAAGENSRNSRG